MTGFAHPSNVIRNARQLLESFARDPDEVCIAIVQLRRDKGMDKLFLICKSECGSLTMFLKWKKEVLHRCLMWSSKVRGSILTPRLVTDVESGIFWPEKVMLIMTDV